MSFSLCVCVRAVKKKQKNSGTLRKESFERGYMYRLIVSRGIPLGWGSTVSFGASLSESGFGIRAAPTLEWVDLPGWLDGLTWTYL